MSNPNPMHFYIGVHPLYWRLGSINAGEKTKMVSFGPIRFCWRIL